MFSHVRLQSTLLVAFMVSLFLPGLAAPEDRDTQEVQGYVLSEAGLAKFAQATKKLAAMLDGMNDTCDEDSDSTSLNDMVAKLNAKPDAKAAIQSAGMTTREYVVFSMSLLQNGLAAWALSQPGGTLPPGVSKANVDFYKKHEVAIAVARGPQGSSDCDEDDRDDDES